MLSEQQEQVELDVYFQGSKDQLFTFLYPLSGPSSKIFDLLKLTKTQFNPNTKQFRSTYEPQCNNIDRQIQPFYYKGTPVVSNSNYFYSAYQPEYKALVWRNIKRFVQMRPQNKQLSKPKNNKDKQQAQNVAESIELTVVQSQCAQNITEDQIQKAPITRVEQNWEVSKQQYVKHLSN